MKKLIPLLFLFLFHNKIMPVVTFNLLAKGEERRLLLGTLHYPEFENIVQKLVKFVTQQLFDDEAQSDGKIRFIYELNQEVHEKSLASECELYIDQGVKYLLDQEDSPRIFFEAYDPREEDCSMVNVELVCLRKRVIDCMNLKVALCNWQMFAGETPETLKVSEYFASLKKYQKYLKSLRDSNADEAYQILNEKYAKFVAGKKIANTYFKEYANYSFHDALGEVIKKHSKNLGALYYVDSIFNFLEQLENELLLGLDCVVADGGFLHKSLHANAGEYLIFYFGHAHFKELVEDHKRLGYDSIASGSTIEFVDGKIIFTPDKQYLYGLSDTVLKLQRGLNYHVLINHLKTACSACGKSKGKYKRYNACQNAYYCNSKNCVSAYNDHQNLCLQSPAKHSCEQCGKSAEKLMRCGTCKKVSYCGRDCQKSAWKTHKLICTAPVHLCGQCGKSKGNLLRCSKCKKAWYCGLECQKLAWKDHKVDCIAVA